MTRSKAVPDLRRPVEEAGALAQVCSTDRVAAAQLVVTGDVHALGLPLYGELAERIALARVAEHQVLRGWSDYISGEATAAQGEDPYVDDTITIPIHSGTHADALGHIIVDGVLWGGRPASASSRPLDWASIDAVASVGVFVRGVVVDVARWRGVESLGPGDVVRLADILGALEVQGSSVRKGDALLVRTGWIGARTRDHGLDGPEPGMTDDSELVDWMGQVLPSVIGTDTFGNELEESPSTATRFPLHRHLLHGLGIGFHEGLVLDGAANACAGDGRWEGLYVASPLRLPGASGSPINPLFVR